MLKSLKDRIEDAERAAKLAAELNELAKPSKVRRFGVDERELLRRTARAVLALRRTGGDAPESMSDALDVLAEVLGDE